MITVTEARKIINENSLQSKKESLSLKKANGYVLAEPTLSVIDTPPFQQSAMDGYAFSFDDWDKKSELKVIGEIQAGISFNQKLISSEAVRIFTGAMLPQGTDTVVMQEKVEKVEKVENTITIKDINLLRGHNVRLKGSQAQKGDVALEAGQLLTPSGISFLAGVGINQVSVYSKPTVSIVVTGKELIQPGDILSEGKIYESNSFGLTAGLKQLNIDPVSTQTIDDNENEIIQAVRSQLQNDFIILTGGVSVGDYDFVHSALEKCGVKKLFHRVKQKPGKPIYFGKLNNTLVFGLPGNPAAVMCCFYEYVVPAICNFTQNDKPQKIKSQLENDFTKKPGLTFFLKGKTGEQGVTILNSQESYLMNSFALADCLIELEEEKEIYKKGDWVKVLML
jgi:molybdopterin molybdotransferase